MRKQVHTNSFGLITVDIYDNTYNGYTIEQIKKMEFSGWSSSDREKYIENCKEVIEIQLSGINLGLIECIKNMNHYIAKQYI